MDIVSAAITIIAQQGFEKLTTKNLAAHLGHTEAALYRHFSSKRDLLEMILCYFEQKSCQVIQDIKAENLKPIDCIRRFVQNRYRMFEEQPDLAMVMFSEELFKNDPSFREQLLSIMHIHRDEVVGYIQAGQKSAEIGSDLNPFHLFRIIVGSMRLIVSQWNLSNRTFPLYEEGCKTLETIIKLIEVNQ
jgi:AcrR family transcriptional regulator